MVPQHTDVQYSVHVTRLIEITPPRSGFQADFLGNKGKGRHTPEDNGGPKIPSTSLENSVQVTIKTNLLAELKHQAPMS